MTPNDLVDTLIAMIESGDWDDADTALLEWALMIAEELLHDCYETDDQLDRGGRTE